jgi:hypothetical protein
MVSRVGLGWQQSSEIIHFHYLEGQPNEFRFCSIDRFCVFYFEYFYRPNEKSKRTEGGLNFSRRMGKDIDGQRRQRGQMNTEPPPFEKGDT